MTETTQRPRFEELPEKQLDFYHKTFETCEKWMKPKHEEWRRLIKQYNLDLKVSKLPADKVVKISRFLPLTRQIITSIAFNYPRIFMRVENQTMSFQAEVLERICNALLEITGVKAEVQQQIFDALYCYIGWVKYGVNPPGDQDVVPPYISNDDMANGNVFCMRVSPFNMFPDPLTPPHKLSHARYVWEKMLVPYEFVQQDERFTKKFRNEIKPLSKENDDDGMLADMLENDVEEESQAVEESKTDGKFVILREFHDRIHQKRLTFGEGVQQPGENIDHPFLSGQSEVSRDPISGEEKLTGRFTPSGGYLVLGGFPYKDLWFDLSHETFYGKPMMAYAEDTQKLIVESVSRRRSLLKQNTRKILGQKNEMAENPNIGDQIARGDEDTIAWVSDVNNSFAEMPTNNVQQDQLGLESDARQYEEQVLQVSQLALGGGPARTATEASLIASFGQLNREWMQDKVAEVYKTTAHNFMRILADRRYTPINFLVNTAETEDEPIFEAVRTDMFKARWKITVEAGSMKPLFEELEREDALALFQFLIRLPEIPRPEAIKHLLRAFRVPNMEKFIGQSSTIDAQRAANYENQLMMAGQKVEVMPIENHRAHSPVHKGLVESPESPLVQGIQQMQQLGPAIQPEQAQQLQQLVQIVQVVQQHLADHQEAFQQIIQGPGGGDGGGGAGPARIKNISDQATGSPESATAGAREIQSAVRSKGQRISQPHNLNRQQN
jgi:hypothetical protein